jgi:hypothetical protein
MNRPIILFPILVAVLIALVVWSPWITKEYAEQKAREEFALSWKGAVDGCGFDCKGCGVKSSQRTLFGYVVTIEFACGLKPGTKTSELFVSALGTVHGSSSQDKF